MGQREKRIQEWLNNPPTDAPFEHVKGVLKHYFAGKIRKKSGSHRVVRDERLAGHPGFGPFGEFAISISGGQRVKGYLLQRLAQAVQIVEEMEED